MCLLVGPHVGRSLDDGGADPVAVGEFGHLVTTTVKKNLTALLLGGSDKALDTSLGGGRDDRTAEVVRQQDVCSQANGNSQVGTILKALVNLELLSTLNQLGNPLLSITNKNSNRDGHAALTSSCGEMWFRICTVSMIQIVHGPPKAAPMRELRAWFLLAEKGVETEVDHWIDNLITLTVWHNDSMIFSSQVCLDALSRRASSASMSVLLCKAN